MPVRTRIREQMAREWLNLLQKLLDLSAEVFEVSQKEFVLELDILAKQIERAWELNQEIVNRYG